MNAEQQLAKEIAAACPSVPITKEPAVCGHVIALVNGKEVHFKPCGGLSVQCDRSTA